MQKFKTHVNTVLDFMIDNHYSQHSLHLYKKVFETLEDYLKTNRLTYSPELGNELLRSRSSVPFRIAGTVLYAAVIKKINSAYFIGSVSNALASSRKSYSALTLRTAFSESLARFKESIYSLFSETRTENIRRRCCLFLKYLQFIGQENLSSITYEDISSYHFSELNRLKPESRMMEEGAICHFLQFLFLEKEIVHSFYMHWRQIFLLIFLLFVVLSKSPSGSIIRYRFHLTDNIR